MSALANALKVLSPKGKWRIEGEQIISNVKWEFETSNKPTDSEIEVELKKQEQIIKDTQYQRDRASAYPPLEEQMDLLYHGGVDALKAELKKTKDKFPKP